MLFSVNNKLIYKIFILINLFITLQYEDLGTQTVRFVKSTKTDEEEEEEIEKQGGPIDNRPLYEKLEEQRQKVFNILFFTYIVN